MYVISGATGNTGKRIAETLLAAGKQVTVISRDAETTPTTLEWFIENEYKYAFN